MFKYPLSNCSIESDHTYKLNDCNFAYENETIDLYDKLLICSKWNFNLNIHRLEYCRNTAQQCIYLQAFFRFNA